MTTIISDAGVQFADNSVQQSAAAPQIISLNATVAANALTITLNPCALGFRATPLTSGAVNYHNIASAISLTISSGSTLGTVNATRSRLVALALNNAGTIELAVVNIAGGNDLTETGLISTTAISAASNSANVIYSTTARSNVPYRVIGYIESTQATAGTWATAPSTIQGAGGQAFAAMSSLGYGQTWQNVTGSRVVGTTYYNTSGKPIVVYVVRFTGSATNDVWSATINGVSIGRGVQAYSANATLSHGFIVPAGASYLLSQANGSSTPEVWAELR